MTEILILQRSQDDPEVLGRRRTKIQVMQPMVVRYDGEYCNWIIFNCDYYRNPFHCDGGICSRYTGGDRSNLKDTEGGKTIRHSKCIKEFGDGKCDELFDVDVCGFGAEE